LLSALVLIVAVCVGAQSLRLFRQGWHGAPLPAAMITKRALRIWCAAGLLLSIQLWVSLRWRNFAAGPALG